MNESVGTKTKAEQISDAIHSVDKAVLSLEELVNRIKNEVKSVMSDEKQLCPVPTLELVLKTTPDNLHQLVDRINTAIDNLNTLLF